MERLVKVKLFQNEDALLSESDIVRVDTIPYEFLLFMMARFSKNVVFPPEFLIDDSLSFLSEQSLNIDKELITQKLGESALFSVTNNDLPTTASGKFNPQNLMYIHAWKYETASIRIIGVNSAGGSILKFYDYDPSSEDADSEGYVHIGDNNNVDVTDLNSDLDVRNMTLVMYSINGSDITNFSPVIHNLSRRAHRELFNDLTISSNIGSISNKTIVDNTKTDIRNNVNYAKQNTPIDNNYQTSLPLLEANFIKEYQSDTSYNGNSDYVGESHCTFLGNLYKCNSGGTPIGSWIDNVLAKSNGNYSMVIDRLLGYSNLTEGSPTSWDPVDRMELSQYEEYDANGNGLRNQFLLNSIRKLQTYIYTDEYMIGDLVIYNDQVFRSVTNNNKFNIPSESINWIKV